MEGTGSHHNQIDFPVFILFCELISLGYNSGDCLTFDSNLDCAYNPPSANGCGGAWLSTYPKFIAGNNH